MNNPWSHSVKTGVWLRALGNGDQRRPMGRKAWEGLYVFLACVGLLHLLLLVGIILDQCVCLFACRHIPELLNYVMLQTFDKSGTYILHNQQSCSVNCTFGKIMVHLQVFATQNCVVYIALTDFVFIPSLLLLIYISAIMIYLCAIFVHVCFAIFCTFCNFCYLALVHYVDEDWN